MTTWQSVGTHRYYRDADLVFFEVHGDFTVPDVQRLFDVVDPISAEYGYVLLGFDANDGGALPLAARKRVSERSRGSHREGATVIIGGSFAMRATIHLVRTAGRLFGLRAPAMFFCPDTPEALRCLAEQRVRCQATRAAAAE